MATSKRLNAVIQIGGTVTTGLKSALGMTTGSLAKMQGKMKDLRREQEQLGRTIGIWKDLGKNVDGLNAKYANLTSQMKRLRQAHESFTKAESRTKATKAVAGKLTSAGAVMTATGTAMLAPAVLGTKEASHYRTEKARIAALGMGDKTNAHAVEFAKGMKTFGTSQLENLELMRDGLSVFADLHHAEMVAPLMAKMKFANKAVFGREQGEANSAQFMDMLKVIETRGGLKSEAEFSKQANIIQQVISATGGRVGATEWRHMLMTGGLAGKGMDSEALFYTMEHMVQEMGGDKAGTGLNSLYKSLYQGVAKKRAVVNLGKLGLIGDMSKVKQDKAGQTASMEPGALLGADLFRANPFDWMEQVLLPQLAKKGITDEKKITDTIGMIVSNSVGGSFLAEMYRQRENIHRARDRNKNAMNIDQLDKEGRQTPEGKQLEAEAKLNDLKLKLGEQTLPLYTRALEMATGAMEKLNEFTEKNPKLATALAVGIGGIGAALVALGPLLVAAGGALGIYAGIQARLAQNAAQAAAAVTAETAAMAEQNAVAGAGGAGKFIGRAGKVFGVGTALASGWEVGTLLNDYAINPSVKALTGGKSTSLGGWIYDATHDDPSTTSTPLPAPQFRRPQPAWAGGHVDNSTNTFHITQLPGEDGNAFALRVADQLKAKKGVAQRSAMTDGGVHQ